MCTPRCIGPVEIRDELSVCTLSVPDCSPTAVALATAFSTGVRHKRPAGLLPSNKRHPLLCTRLGHDADARRTCVGTDVVRGLDLCRSLQISAHGAHTQLLTRPPDYLRLLNQLNAVGFYADPTPPVWAIQPTLLHHYLGSYCATLIMITNHDYDYSSSCTNHDMITPGAD